MQNILSIHIKKQKKQSTNIFKTNTRLSTFKVSSNKFDLDSFIQINAFGIIAFWKFQVY